MQVHNDTIQEEQPKEAAQQPLTREQRRKKEQIEKDAEDTFNKLSNRFLDFFVESDDPEGNEVHQKLVQISSQWKAYCSKRQLIPEAKTMIDTFAASVFKDYYDNKTPKADANQIPN